MTVTITNGTIKGGHSTYDAGAIMNYGDLNLENVTLSGNNGKYGAIYNYYSDHMLCLNNVTIKNNTSYEHGAAIYNRGI